MSLVIGDQPLIRKWSGVASAMAAHLELRATSPDNPGERPQAIFAAAQRFFRLVLDALCTGIPQDPVRSAHAYRHSLEALDRAGIAVGKTEDEKNELLRQYAAVVDKLNSGLQLDEENNPQVLQDMAQFFRALVRQGDEERHSGCSPFDGRFRWLYRY